MKRKAKHLCVIDNDKIYQFTLRKTLEMMDPDTRLSIFDNGQYAINFLKRHLAEPESFPDLIFLDINMPVLDGWGFIREFDQLQKLLPKPVYLYLLTSSIDDKDRERSRKFSSVKGYRMKPLSHHELEVLLSELAVAESYLS